MRWTTFSKSKKIPKHIASFISNKIEQLMNEGYPQQQAIARAYSEARKKYPKAKGIQRYALNLQAKHLGKPKHEMTHSEWEYYGGKYSGEPEPKEF